MVDEKPLRVAVLGCGVVGSQVVRLLEQQAGDLAARVGRRVELAGVAVRRIDAPRDVTLLNAGAAIYVAGEAERLTEGVEMAANAVDSGAAERVLADLVETSAELAAA